MSHTKRTRWADVYRTETPMHAKLIASVLGAQGLNTRVQRKKLKDAVASMPFVRVEASQEQAARDILADYKLQFSEVA